MMMRVLWKAMLLSAFAAPAIGQTPLSLTTTGSPQSQAAKPPAETTAPRPNAAQGAAPSTQPPVTADPNAPASTTVGFPVFPGAQFLAAYDAGKGQRYYIFGATAGYVELVKWYQTQLRDRGDEVFAAPATHMFAQRFREETMAFPPGVTVKDWTYGGSKGYPNPKLGAQPARFPSIIMIVPPLPPEPTAR